MMSILGSAKLKIIRDTKLTNAALIAAWDAHQRLAAYIGTAADFADAMANRPGAAMCAPYSLFIIVAYTGPYISSYQISFPVDSAGDYSSLTPTTWSNLFTETGFSPDDLNGLIRSSNFMSAYYQVPRGNEADIDMVPAAEGLMYFAKDSIELYMFFNGGWHSINAGAIDEVPIGGIITWSEALPVPHYKYLKCNGAFVKKADWMRLYDVVTNFGTQDNPYDSVPPTAGPDEFKLPEQTNCIIKGK